MRGGSGKAIDLVPAGTEPPCDAPAEHDRDERALERSERRGAKQLVRSDNGAARDEQRAETVAVQHRNVAGGAGGRPRRECQREGDARGELQQQPERACGEVRLSHADPDGRGAFERPRRGRQPRVECERHRERREDDAEREKRVDEQTQFASRKKTGERQVDRSGHDRAPRERVRDVAHERILQTGCDERRAEHDRRIDIAAKLERAAQRVQRRDRDVEEEEQDQERLRRREVLGPIRRHAP